METGEAREDSDGIAAAAATISGANDDDGDATSRHSNSSGHDDSGDSSSSSAESSSEHEEDTSNHENHAGEEDSSPVGENDDSPQQQQHSGYNAAIASLNYSSRVGSTVPVNQSMRSVTFSDLGVSDHNHTDYASGWPAGGASQRMARVNSENDASTDSGFYRDQEGGDDLGPMNSDDDDIELGFSAVSSRGVDHADEFYNGPMLRSRGAGGGVSQIPQRQRRSNSVDLVTGTSGRRGHHAVVRSQADCFPRSNRNSRTSMLVNNIISGSKRMLMKDSSDDEGAGYRSDEGLMRLGTLGEVEEIPVGSPRRRRSRGSQGSSIRSLNNVLDDENHQTPVHGDEGVSSRQYCLKAVKPTSNKPRLWRWLGIASDNHISVFEDLEGNSLRCCGISPNSFVIKYLHWTFRSSFLAVFVSAAILFFALTMLFAVPIYGIGQRHPSCIGGVTGEEATEPQSATFVDSYELSWTTFSTVGYGLVYSGISADEPNAYKCVGITIIVTAEAFIGVLFASMFGAVMFAKVARIQSYAQVVFSDPIVIRYGSGVAVEHDLDGDDDLSVDDKNERLPCPVLEFRLNNRLSATVGGEIIDASLNIVASIDSSQAVVATQARRRRRGGKKGKHKGARGATRKRNSLRLPDPSQSLIDSTSITVASLKQTAAAANRQEAFVEDPTGYLVPRRVFSKLEIETPDHPFFKRVWFVRHTLDENSPLVLPAVRQLIRQQGGYWPAQLNSYEGVRSGIRFDQILVSLSGTSNADANSVYAQKVYDYVDVNVGYTFVNQLFRDAYDGSLLVDNSLINDVMEQAGGGGEPLAVEHEFSEKLTDMLVL